MMDEKDLEIVKMSLEDLHRVQMIAQEEGLSPWSNDDYAREVSNPQAIALVAKRKQRVLGFLVARLITTDNCIEIHNLAVGKEFHRQSIGATLLDTLNKYLRFNRLENIYLEVREKNPGAIRFYQNQGFTVIGKRKNFYKNPPDHAILMESRSKLNVEIKLDT